MKQLTETISTWCLRYSRSCVFEWFGASCLGKLSINISTVRDHTTLYQERIA